MSEEDRDEANELPEGTSEGAIASSTTGSGERSKKKSKKRKQAGLAPSNTD